VDCAQVRIARPPASRTHQNIAPLIPPIDGQSSKACSDVVIHDVDGPDGHIHSYVTYTCYMYNTTHKQCFFKARLRFVVVEAPYNYYL